jgi:hypothetical protein
MSDLLQGSGNWQLAGSNVCLTFKICLCAQDGALNRIITGVKPCLDRLFDGTIYGSMYTCKFNLFLFPLCGVIYRSEAAVHLVYVWNILESLRGLDVAQRHLYMKILAAQ